MSRRASFTFAIIVSWLTAITAAAWIDAAVATTVRSSGSEQFLRSTRYLAAILKSPGTYWFTVVVALAVLWKHRLRWRAALFFLLATAVSAVNGAIKWLVGRYRPFKVVDGSGRLAPFELHPFPAGGRNLCFPSGHACLAFATAAALGMLWPKWRWVFYAGAAVVALERVAENAHWLSDVVAGAALGIGGVHAMRWLLKKRLFDVHQERVIEMNEPRPSASAA
jgi:membrane-associated phospholipid phosphatase